MIERQTDYVEPNLDVVTELVEQLLRDAGQHQSPEQWQWVRSGSSSLVVLAGEAAVRVGRDNESAVEIQRTQKLVDKLPRLFFGIPRSLAAQIADAPTVRRAEVFRRAFPLMIVAFAVLRSRPESEVARILDRATDKLRQ